MKPVEQLLHVGAGQLWEWGSVRSNRQEDLLTPVQSRKISDVAGYSAGISVDAVIKKDGTVVVLSGNDYGQRGDGTRITKMERYGQWVAVPGTSKIVRLDTPGFSSTIIAYREDGTVLERGGQLLRPKGLTMSTYRYYKSNVPVNTTPTPSRDLQGFKRVITSGFEYNGLPTVLALKADGSVWSWGDNRAHLLADAKVTERYAWAQIPGLPSIIQIAGWYTGYAVGKDGSLWGWGGASSGELGNVNVPYRDTPMPIGEFVGKAKKQLLNRDQHKQLHCGSQGSRDGAVCVFSLSLPRTNPGIIGLPA